MPNIEATITLKDNASSVCMKLIGSLDRIEQLLTKIQSDTNKISTTFDKVRASSDGVNNAVSKIKSTEEKVNTVLRNTETTNNRLLSVKNKILSAIRRNTTAQSKHNERLRAATTATNNNAKAQQRHNTYLRGATTEASRLLSTLKNVLGVYAIQQGGKGLLNLADTVTMNRARLGIVNELNGSLHETAEIEQMIYEASMRSRGSYIDTAKVVSGMGIRAADAFGNVGEIVQFTEVLNKMGAISGASANEVTNALYQINQAMGAGKFQGDEFRSVSENLPLALQAVAKYKNVSIGALKDMAKKGEITADVFKNAIFSMTDEVNDRFKKIPLTWSQCWNIAKNVLLKISDSILAEISEITSSERFKGFAQGLSHWVEKRVIVLTDCFRKLKEITAHVYDNWSEYKPIIMGVATAMAIYNGVMAIATVTGAIFTKMQAVSIANEARLNKVRFAARVQQYGLNAAMWSCPIMWFTGGLVILIGVIVGVMRATYDWEAANIDTWGTIKNIGRAAVEVLKSAWRGFCEYVKPAIEAIGNTFKNISQAIVDNWSKIEYAIKMVIGAIIVFGQMMSNVFSVVASYVVQLWDSLAWLREYVVELGNKFVENLDKVRYAFVIVIGSVMLLGQVIGYVSGLIIDGLSYVCNSLGWVSDVCDTVSNFFVEHWGTIQNVLLAVLGVVVFLGYALYTVGEWAVSGITLAWDALCLLWDILLTVGEVAVKIAGWIVDAWTFISPLIMGIVATFGTLLLTMGFVASAVLIGIALWGVYSAVVAIAKGVMALFTIATWKQVYAYIAATVAGWAASSPLLFWIVVIGIIIGVIALLIQWIASWCGVSLSATGMICGAFCWLAATVWNVIVGVWNGILQFFDAVINQVLGVVEWWINVFNGGFDSFGDAVAALLGNIISWFLDLGQVVTKIIDAIFGTDWTAGLESLKSRVLSWGKSKGYIELDENYASKTLALERVSATGAWDAGYKFGEGIENGIGDLTNMGGDFMGKLGDIGSLIEGNGENFMKGLDGVGGKIKGVGENLDFSNFGVGGSNLGTNLGNLIKTNDGSGNGLNNDISKALGGNYDTSNQALDKIAGDTSKIANNTGSSAGSLDASSEDTKYLRQLAEREAIQKYTLTDLNFNMNNNNTFNSKREASNGLRRLLNVIYQDTNERLMHAMDQ